MNDVSYPSLIDQLDLVGPQVESSGDVADILRGDEPVPEWWIKKIGTRAAKFLRKLCPELRVGDVAVLSREKMSGYSGYGKGTIDAIMELTMACRDGTVWTPIGFHAKHASEFDSLSDMILQSVQDSVALTDTYRTVMRMNLGVLDSEGYATLGETGEALHLTHERVRQLGKKVLENLRMAFSAGCFQELVAWSSKFFEERGLEASKDEFVDAVAREFGWTKPTLFSLRHILKELGFITQINPLTGNVVWTKKGDPIPTPPQPVLRRMAIKEVLQEAGRSGLAIDEILSACKAKFPHIEIVRGNVRGCLNAGNDLDESGTRMIGYSRGKRGDGGTRYSLNTFFQDEATKSVLENAGAEVKAYMEKTGFGVVDVWKIWEKYKDVLPEEKRLPKLGFYMMMRDFKAGDLCYKDYPRISYEGMEVCQNAYWWELYEYFRYCGHPNASFAQIMSFFVDCLGIQPNIALSCAFCSMGLKKEAETTNALYVIRRPPIPKVTPTVLLNTLKKDESLSLIAADGKYTIHSDYFDENGRALYHPTYVKVFLRALEKTGHAFLNEEVTQLTDAGWCKQNLGISKPFLKKVEGVEQEKGKGYWLEKFTFGDGQFYACYDWDQQNKAAFDKWAVASAKSAGMEFAPYDIGLADDIGGEEDKESIFHGVIPHGRNNDLNV